MATNEKKLKGYRFDDDVLGKLSQLMEATKIKNPGINVYEQDVVIEAINFYHSSIFGKDVFDQTMHKLETVIGNRVDHIMAQHTQILGELINNTHNQALLSKEATYLLLLATGSMKPDIDKDVLQNIINRNVATNMLISRAVANRDRDER